MNHRSTFTVEHRPTSGHRYRYADEYTSHPQARRAPAAAPETAWPQQDIWNDRQDWSGDNAWTPAEDEWTPDESDTYDSGAYNTGTYNTGGYSADAAWGPAATEPEPQRVERRGGAHRVPAPPTALKGRAAVIAVAAGAVVAAGQAAMAEPAQPHSGVDYEAAGQIHEIAAQSMNTAEVDQAGAGATVLEASAIADKSHFDDILAKGQKFAEDLAAQESAKLRPLFAKFTTGNYTSGFGARWGVQHLGIDVAGPIGTPIYSVADGTVIEAGPASGFGMWVRVLHDDGTVTIYGHIDTATVSQGERVLAGDQIATMGNRGFSTGPHCHFEVWLNGTDKIDPVPWLATRGISLGAQRD
ncbi:peptidase M23-like protein [Nocardia neocaledoniensis]|uniref:Peptidase M23-like protein n=2 Tax=Nocardia neocaledoniensis TaxID=236511 RepID=A0A317NB17_9NOCA|nr:M23 family metallopeptidase [Nocardia neocaledoniensis]PWV72164.1 peptidase M23-like protein [Nocardia neocaledoniensis]